MNHGWRLLRGDFELRLGTVACHPFAVQAYSRLVTMPGCGTGYLPSSPAGSGAGESIVSLSTPGAIFMLAVEHVRRR